MSRWQRTQNCGELRESDIGKTVVLNGWVNAYRNHGVFVFIDLRDRYGITQVVFEPERGQELFKLAQTLRVEFVLSVRGKVGARLPGKENAEMITGSIEVKVDEMEILNRCPTPPFEVTEFSDDEQANEDLRLQYRFLDLRRPSLQKTLRLRHRLNQVIRDYLDKRDFLEIETPLLGRSSPEGARDYLVPSRVSPGTWYALPQSPQLYKQLLMIAGYDKYFQIAHCLRDEDLRADRQPEFTQLDLEMTFVEMDDVLKVMEGLSAEIFKTCLNVTIDLPLPRLTYANVMLRYGSDKPDLRFGLEIQDVSAIVKDCTFKVFLETLEKGNIVRGLNVKGGADKFSNTDLKPGGKLSEFVGRYGAKGLAWFKVEGEKLVSSLEKFFPKTVQDNLRHAMQAEQGDLLLFVADKEDVVCQALGNLRLHMANTLKLFDPNALVYKLAWIVDFPLFIRDEEEKRWAANHHPFTAPRDEDLDKLESDSGSVLAKAYDPDQRL